MKNQKKKKKHLKGKKSIASTIIHYSLWILIGILLLFVVILVMVLPTLNFNH